jgi:hypothetical protein
LLVEEKEKDDADGDDEEVSADDKGRLSDEAVLEARVADENELVDDEGEDEDEDEDEDDDTV